MSMGMGGGYPGVPPFGPQDAALAGLGAQGAGVQSGNGPLDQLLASLTPEQALQLLAMIQAEQGGGGAPDEPGLGSAPPGVGPTIPPDQAGRLLAMLQQSGAGSPAPLAPRGYGV